MNCLQRNNAHLRKYPRPETHGFPLEHVHTVHNKVNKNYSHQSTLWSNFSTQGEREDAKLSEVKKNGSHQSCIGLLKVAAQKYSGISLTKEAKVSHTENYKMSLKIQTNENMPCVHGLEGIIQ
jgi:hypothetical protein